jgi:hypothetical protein
MLDFGFREYLERNVKSFPLFWKILQCMEDLKLSQEGVGSTLSCGYPCNGLWGPIGLWAVGAPTLSRQSAYRGRLGCQPYAPAALYLPGRFLVLISATGWANPMAIVRLEGLGKLQKSMSSSGIEPANFRPVTAPQPTTLQSAPIFWDITLSNRFKSNRRFGEKYRLLLQSRIREAW